MTSLVLVHCYYNAVPLTAGALGRGPTVSANIASSDNLLAFMALGQPLLESCFKDSQ